MAYISLYDESIYGLSFFLFFVAVVKIIFIKKIDFRLLYALEILSIFTIAMVVAYYIGTRPDNTVGDTETYVSFYTDLMQGSSNNFDIGFVVISQWFVFLGLSYISLFVLVPFLLLVSYYRLCLAQIGRAHV